MTPSNLVPSKFQVLQDGDKIAPGDEYYNPVSDEGGRRGDHPMSAQINTNHHWRPFLHRAEVPEEVIRFEFSHLDPDDDDGFFRYRGAWYHVSDFSAAAPLEWPGKPWDGLLADSFFSGVVINLSDDGERYQVGTLIS